MANSDNEPACPEAAVWGGCPGRNGGPVPPLSFSCKAKDCPLIARANEFYGVTAISPRLRVRMMTGATILPFPANDNHKPN